MYTASVEFRKYVTNDIKKILKVVNELKKIFMIKQFNVFLFAFSYKIRIDVGGREAPWGGFNPWMVGVCSDVPKGFELSLSIFSHGAEVIKQVDE